ncbi:hypothetical protein FHS95_003587 [Sphingomonas naasensis]|uniref:Uncharacterized protein n=1 Tax=Sphingomonas naasensis TaxID=1344951 RepID=A0A4S1WH37_9SPHN|nr:hypothetical protein [Sphingomonas naasensis]NIJ21876.1 hypothetical protein [Sphingomonas naasensis]TGX42428.1 hypothetical protein E5A74_11345 [Sphingomonas naasensis]
MVPLRPARLFRSRWAALLWAAGVIFTAVSFIGLGDSESHAVESKLVDATGVDVSNADLAVLANALSE